MLATTTLHVILLINAAMPYMEAIALHNKVWAITISVMKDLNNDEFWNQKSKKIMVTRLNILKYTRPNNAAEFLLPHITERSIDTFKRMPDRIEYPVFGILLAYDASITEAIFDHLSNLDQADQEKMKTTIYLCYGLFDNLYCKKIDGKAILIRRIEHEIKTRPRDKRDALKELLKLASKGK